VFQIPSRRRLEHFAGTMGKLGLAFVGVLLGCTFLSWVVMLGGAAGMQAKCGGCRFLKPTRHSLLPPPPIAAAGTAPPQPQLPAHTFYPGPCSPCRPGPHHQL
jgi:hypothetical protein